MLQPLLAAMRPMYAAARKQCSSFVAEVEVEDSAPSAQNHTSAQYHIAWRVYKVRHGCPFKASLTTRRVLQQLKDVLRYSIISLHLHLLMIVSA